jgi:hypothetical protein
LNFVAAVADDAARTNASPTAVAATTTLAAVFDPQCATAHPM